MGPYPRIEAAVPPHMIRGGDTEAGFSIETLAGGEVLHLRLWGAWAESHARAFEAAFRGAREHMRARWCVVVDGSRFVSRKSIADRMRGLMRESAVRGLTGTASIVGPRLARAARPRTDGPVPWFALADEAQALAWAGSELEARRVSTAA